MAVRAYKDKKGNVIPDKFFIDYYPQGRKGKKVIEVFSGTAAEAHEYEMQVRRTHAKTMPVSPKLVDVIPLWLEWLKLHRSESYYNDVNKTLKWLRPYFGNLQFPRITEALINQYKTNRRGESKNLCVRAINKELGNLSALISWAVKKGYANPLPFTIEKLPYRRPIPQIPHPVEIDKFLEELKPVPASPKALKRDPEANTKRRFEADRKKALILLMWEGGLRWKEASNIRWENIDWIHGHIMLVITKGGRPRQAALTRNIRALLEPQKKNEGWVFENPATGKPWTTLKTLFKTLCESAKIKHIHPHLLRHAFGTYTLEATGDLRLVQDLLGHRDVGTTQFYTQVATHRLKAGIQQTADYVSKLKSEKAAENKKE